MQPRYHVDQEEFQRLQELAQERRAARHYGRGIRSEHLDDLDSVVKIPELVLLEYLYTFPIDVNHLLHFNPSEPQ